MNIALISLSPASFDLDIQRLLERIGFSVIVIQQASVSGLDECDGYVLLGKDFIHESLQESIISVLQHANIHSKPILGIGEGASVLLTQTGIIPGIEKNKPAIKLTPVQESSETTLRLGEPYQYNAFTRRLSEEIELIGRTPIKSTFKMSTALQLEMEANGLIVFYYGKTTHSAALSNKQGNAMVFLPYLENTENTELLFYSMYDYLKKGYKQWVHPLAYYPRYDI